jgi:hypothetical protein
MNPTEFSQWRPHPWHGLDTGRDPPVHVNAYIEITPFDLIKYESTRRPATCASTGRSEPRRNRHRSTDSSLAPTAASVSLRCVPVRCAGTATRSTSASSASGPSPAARSSSPPAWSAASSCSTAVRPTTRSSPCSRATMCGITSRTSGRRSRPSSSNGSQHYFSTYKLVPGAICRSAFRTSTACTTRRASFDTPPRPSASSGP